MTDTVTISRDHYEQLVRDSEFLNALRGAGVDNWDGYGYALELLNEEDE